MRVTKLYNLTDGMEPSLKETLSTVDLQVLTSLHLLLLIMQAFFPFFTKQATLMRRSTVPSLPLRLEFPANSICCRYFKKGEGEGNWLGTDNNTLCL